MLNHALQQLYVHGFACCTIASGFIQYDKTVGGAHAAENAGALIASSFNLIAAVFGLK